MNYKIFIISILAASLLSSVAALNVPVFADGDKDHNDDDNDNGNGDAIQAKNDDGQQSIGVNECSNIQEDFENSNNNVQNLNCEILINNLQDTRNTTNIVDNDETPETPVDGGDGDGAGEFGEECALCLADLAAEEVALLLAAFNVDTIAELCELIEAGTITLDALGDALDIILADVAAVDAIIECILAIGV